MPRTPDAANLDNRIRKLREQIKVTQDRLGEVLGMNGDAIRNLENGRMKISAGVLRRIIIAIGAEYSTARKIWLVPLSRRKCSPATFMAWKQAARPSNMQKKKDCDALTLRVAALLAYAKPDEYNMLFMRLSELLDDCLTEHPSPEAKEVFQKSTPQMNIRRVPAKETVDDEEFSVAEEKRLPTIPFPNSEICEVTRIYNDHPKAEEILPGAGSNISDPA